MSKNKNQTKTDETPSKPLDISSDRDLARRMLLLIIRKQPRLLRPT